MTQAGHALALAVVLAGCAAGARPIAQSPRTGAQFAPDANGLSMTGTGLRIDFGRAPSGVITALDRELGKGRLLGLDGCPAGIVQQEAWGDLVLTFTAERFVGWQTADGVAGQACS